MAAIDILMPMRDAEPWVGAAWRSLARQGFRDWRLVAVDDGSADATVVALAEAARGDPRLHLYTQGRLGVVAALNRGLRQVAAPVVARMDADDLSHPARLHDLWQLLAARKDLSVVASQVRMFPRSRVSPRMAGYLAWQNSLVDSAAIWRERFIECTVAHGATAFRTRCLVDVGGWREEPGPEDLDLFLRLHAAGARFAKVRRVLYFWREHRRRETRCSPRCSPRAFRRTKARHLARAVAGRRVALLGRSRSGFLWSEALAREGVQTRCADYHPRDPIPPWTDLAVFCFGDARVRNKIRRSLHGLREGRDYLFVA